MSLRTHEHGFTLIELSIVLVIIGLIIGGVLMGRDLIKAAEMRALSSETENYKLVINTFKLKYNALPGDFSGASTLWSGARNGNGNGSLDGFAVADSEHTAAWHHLSSAELIGGNYPTVFHYGSFSTYPQSGYGKGIWVFWHHSDMADDANGLSLQSSVGHSSKVVAPFDALQIDTKMDDGLPRTGNLRAGALYNTYNHNTCMDSVAAGADPPDTANYLSDENTQGCNLWIKYIR